jgi:hypothetical protein
VRLPKPVESDVDVKLEIRIRGETVLGNFVNPMRLKPVRRKIDIADAIISDKQIDDLGNSLRKVGSPPLNQRSVNCGEFCESLTISSHDRSPF